MSFHPQMIALKIKKNKNRYSHQMELHLMVETLNFIIELD